MDAEWGESLLEAYDADSADEYGGNDDSSVDESDLSEEDYADLSRPSQPLAREAPRKRLRNGQAKLSRVAQPKKSAGQTADEKARALLGLDELGDDVDLEASEAVVLTRAVSIASSTDSSRKRKRARSKAGDASLNAGREAGPSKEDLAAHLEGILRHLTGKAMWLRTVDPHGRALYKPVNAESDRYFPMAEALQVLEAECQKDARTRSAVELAMAKLSAHQEAPVKVNGHRNKDAPQRKRLAKQIIANGKPRANGVDGRAALVVARRAAPKDDSAGNGIGHEAQKPSADTNGHASSSSFVFRTADGKSFKLPFPGLGESGSGSDGDGDPEGSEASEPAEPSEPSEPSESDAEAPGRIVGENDTAGSGGKAGRHSLRKRPRPQREPERRRPGRGGSSGERAKVLQKEANARCLAYLFTRRDALEPFLDEEAVLKMELAAKDMKGRHGDGNGSANGGVDQAYPQPETVHRKLRDFQVVGMNFLISMYDRRCSCILGDEMGLGKTLQVISFLAHLKFARKEAGPFLVVAPTSVVNFWVQEISVSCPSLRVRAMMGTMELVERAKSDFLRERDDVLVTTYKVFSEQRSRAFWRRRSFVGAILDEGHRLKSMSSPITVAFCSLRRRLGWTAILSGTVVQENVDSLFTLLNFLHPGVFTSPERFRDRQEPDAELLLSRLLAVFMLRRMKYDVEKSILPLVDTVVHCGLAAEQFLWYRRLMVPHPKLLDELERSFRMEESTAAQKDSVPREERNGRPPDVQVDLIWSLLRVSNHPYLVDGVEADRDSTTLEKMVFASGKLRVLDRILVRLWNERGTRSHRVVIFCHMIDTLDLLDDYCRMRGWKALRVDGGTKTGMRSVQIALFNNLPDSEAFICLLSVKTGGYGLNFQAADTVVLFDAGFSPYDEQQAISRVHRIGQRNKVHVYRLVTTGTIEEQVRFRSQQKLALSSALSAFQLHDQEKTNESLRQAFWESMGAESKDELGDSPSGHASSTAAGRDRMPSPTITDEELDCLLDRNRAEEDALVGRLEVAKWDGSLLREKRSALNAHVSKLVPSLLFGHRFEVPDRVVQYSKLSRNFEKQASGSNDGWSYQIEDKAGQKKGASAARRMDSGSGDSFDSGDDQEAVLHVSFPRGHRAGKQQERSRSRLRRFRHEDFCFGCWEGGRLVCCEECPICYCLQCAKVDERDLHNLAWKCDHHHCHGCKRSEKECPVVFRCEVCPETYCLDCVPSDIWKRLRGLSCARLDAKGYVPGSNVCYMLCSVECETFAQSEAALPANWMELLEESSAPKRDLDFAACFEAEGTVGDPQMDFEEVVQQMMNDGARLLRRLLLKAFSVDQLQSSADCKLGELQWPDFREHQYVGRGKLRSDPRETLSDLFDPRQLAGFFFLLENGVDLDLANEEFKALMDSQQLQLQGYRRHEDRTIKIFEAQGALLKDVREAAASEKRRLNEAKERFRQEIYPKVERVLLQHPGFSCSVCEEHGAALSCSPDFAGLCATRTSRRGTSSCRKSWHLCRLFPEGPRRDAFLDVLEGLAQDEKIRLTKHGDGMKIALSVDEKAHGEQRGRLRARIEAVKSFVRGYLGAVGWASSGELLNVANLQVAEVWNRVQTALESGDGDYGGIGAHYGYRTDQSFERLVAVEYDGVAAVELPPTLVPESPFSAGVILRTWGSELRVLQLLLTPLASLAKNGHKLVRVVDAESALRELVRGKKIKLESDKDCSFYALRDYAVPLARYKPNVSICQAGMYWHRQKQQFAAVYEPLLDDLSSDASKDDKSRYDLGLFKSEEHAKSCWEQNVLPDEDHAVLQKQPQRRRKAAGRRKRDKGSNSGNESKTLLETLTAPPQEQTTSKKRTNFFSPEDFATEQDSPPSAKELDVPEEAIEAQGKTGAKGAPTAPSAKKADSRPQKAAPVAKLKRPTISLLDAGSETSESESDSDSDSEDVVDVDDGHDDDDGAPDDASSSSDD